MKFRHFVLPALFLAAPTIAMAQGASRYAPGHQPSSTTKGGVAPGPGQSEYAPGHLKEGKAQSAKTFTPAYRAKHPETTGSRRR